jgi:hypothetical protein
MILTENMRAVIVRIHKLKIYPDFVSPNLVADIANEMECYLTSEQIVYISDNFK